MSKHQQARDSSTVPVTVAATASPSQASSPLESSSNTMTNTLRDEEDTSEPEIDSRNAARTDAIASKAGVGERGTPSLLQRHQHEKINMDHPEYRKETLTENDENESASGSDDQQEDDDNDLEEEHPDTHLPRQGLPSFWYALKRLNLREPRSIIHSLNFFRWHVIIGLLVPLITAGIFYACNTEVSFAYIDALFMCTSALTLTGLSSILLGDMSFGQQFILYLLLQFGSIQFVSLLVLFVRRSTFSKKFDPNRSYWPHKSIIMKDEELDLANGILDDPDETPQLDENGLRKRKKGRRKERVPSAMQLATEKTRSRMKYNPSSDERIEGNGDTEKRRKRDKLKLKRMNSPLSMQSADYASHPLKRSPKQGSEPIPQGMPNKINAPNDVPPARNATSTSTNHLSNRHRSPVRQRTLMPSNTESSNLRRATTTRNAAGRTGTTVSNGTGKIARSPHAHPHRHHHQSARGGFPNPIQAIFSEGVYQLKKRSSNTQYTSGTSSGTGPYPTENGLHGVLGFPRSDTLLSRRSGLGRVGTRLTTSNDVNNIDLENGTSGIGDDATGTRMNQQVDNDEGTRPKRQVSVPASSAYRFGRNSTVRNLSRDAHQKLAQLEISGMTLLMYIIVIWWLGLQLLCVIIWSPYFAAGYFDEVFQQYNPEVSRVWFSVFQSASMLNNCGLSLVDGSLVPFRTCYIMLVPGVFLMVCGNLGYPISLRFTTWLVHACLRATSKLRFITSFMLAHPRRIFYYIFPPYETRALFLVVMLLTAIDWGCFFLLDVGFTSPVFSISTGTAVLSGLVQSVAVRSAGFYTVPLYQVAPALDMLYLFMMAFCVYPLALAIRATNVYEERSLGIQHDDEHSGKEGLLNLRRETGYSKFHLREQLAYDVWYILLAYWLICIVERNNIGITGADPAGSIDMFAILFEVTSAYANVGFSIGSPTVDTSISGNLRHLSKLILCATMIRGRTRGLPVLVDRAVLTPRQLERYGDPADGSMSDEDEHNI